MRKSIKKSFSIRWKSRHLNDYGIKILEPRNKRKIEKTHSTKWVVAANGNGGSKKSFADIQKKRHERHSQKSRGKEIERESVARRKRGTGTTHEHVCVCARNDTDITWETTMPHSCCTLSNSHTLLQLKRFNVLMFCRAFSIVPFRSNPCSFAGLLAHSLPFNEAHTTEKYV